MVKYIYKVVVLMVLFCGALFFFGSRLQNDSYETGKVIEAGNETFPYLTIKSQGVEMTGCMVTVGYSMPISCVNPSHR